jgi:hypothetical protein
LNAQYHNGLLTATANTVSTVVARDASGNFSAGTITATFSGNISNGTGSHTTATLNGGGSTTAGQLTFSGATNNWIDFGTTGVAAPAFTTRSAGLKIALYSGVTGSTTDYGLGIESGFLWFGTQTTSTGFKWYGGTTLAATLTGGGALTLVGALSATTLTSTVSTGTAPLTVSSTTLVTNLNADLLDGLNSATANTVSTIVARDASGNFSAGTITATLSGNASTATQVVVTDSRNTVTTPQTINQGVVFDFKANSTESLSDGGTYFGEMTFRQYGSSSDWSGGLSHQLGFTDNGNIWQRSGSTTTWAAWKKLVDSSNYSSYAIARGGDTVTNAINFQSNLGTTLGALSSPPLQAYATGTNSAFMSFHRSGSYAVNMGLDSDNVLRIGGWSASANRLQMDMSGNLTMAGTVTASSDIRLKDNIETIKNGLEKVLNLNGVTFTRKDQEDKTKIHVGLIAQEVEEVIPEIVSEDNLGMKSVAYANMVAVLIEAIKEQQIQIDTLRKEVEDLKNK